MINFEKRDKIDIVTFTINKIDALITDEIRKSISGVFETAHSMVIINLSGVNYIDSSGLGCFLSIQKAARNNYGTLRFAEPEPAIMELFRTLQLHTIFTVHSDLESCIKSFT